VSRAAHAKFSKAAEARGTAIAELVEEACANLPTEPAAIAALVSRVWANMPQISRTVHGG
jgi:hypothetical protein